MKTLITLLIGLFTAGLVFGQNADTPQNKKGPHANQKQECVQPDGICPLGNEAVQQQKRMQRGDRMNKTTLANQLQRQNNRGNNIERKKSSHRNRQNFRDMRS